MRHVGAVRAELGIPTVFNFLGPLTNPAQPLASAIGVFDTRMASLVAGVLATREGSALVFRGEDGLDELSTTSPTQVWVVADGQVTQTRIEASSLGLATATLTDLRGGDAAHNAGVVREMLAGKPGPVRDAVLLNVAGASPRPMARRGRPPERLRTGPNGGGGSHRLGCCRRGARPVGRRLARLNSHRRLNGHWGLVGQ
jgi:anthranilate phosphoribosyltransferase